MAIAVAPSCTSFKWFPIVASRLQLWTSLDTHVFAVWMGASVLTRVLLACVIGNVPLTMLLNAMHSVGMIARVISSSRTNELERFITLEIITCLVAVGVSALFESLFRRQMRATLEASLATESERTAKELLIPRLRRSGDLR